jgi:ATP-dependent DNA ligase
MEARTVKSLPASGSYQFEPKWDGFRAIAFKDGDDVFIQSKSGQPLARYFPEIVEAIRKLPPAQFVIDGEIVVPVDDRLDFDQLLQRIHPAASRVNMLAREFPATYVVFDVLVDDKGRAIHREPLSVRRPALERLFETFKNADRFRLSPATADRNVVDAWFAQVGGAIDGIVAKQTDVPYSSGDRRGMQKIKRLRTADCVIAGYRATEDGGAVGSLLLGLYDVQSKTLEYVGFTSGFTAAEKRSLLERLSAMKVERSFTGRSPGGESRWNRGKDTGWTPVDPTLVLEVEFDHVSGERFRHGTRPIKFRPDKSPLECTMEQLQQPAATAAFTLAVVD